jgi:hypothetical protein
MCTATWNFGTKVVQGIEAAPANLQASIRCWQLTAKIFDHQATCQFLGLDSTVSKPYQL